MSEKICPLCKRPLEGATTMHHLIPVLKGGKSLGTVRLHQVCHDKIHSVFTEKELARSLNTIEKLLQTQEMQTFVEWISKKPNDFKVTFKQHSRRK